MNPLFLLMAVASSPPFDYTGKTLRWYGDSITAGTYTTTVGNRFTTVASDLLGAIEVNHGEPGSTMEKRSPLNPLLGGVNMVDRLSLIPDYDPDNPSTNAFVYGMNDGGFVSANYTVENFKTDYRTVMTSVIVDKGYPPERNLICSPSYPSDAAFDFYFDNPNWTIDAPPTRERFDAFAAACAEIANEFNTQYFDLYAATRDSGLLGSLNEDGVHPDSVNDDLMIFMGTGIANALT